MGSNVCAVDGCEKTLRKNNESGFCSKHYHFSEGAKTSKKKWKTSNPEKRRVADRKRYSENKVNIRARKRVWEANNRTKKRKSARRYYERNAEMLREKSKKWAKENPDYILSRNQEREARKQDLFVEEVDRALVFQRDGGICHVCLEPVDKKNWHLEHIIPLTDGGPHCYDNVAVSHPKCNPKNKPAGSSNKILEYTAWEAFMKFHGLVGDED